MVIPHFNQGNNHLQVPDPNPALRRGSDPGPSVSHYGLGTGAGSALAAGGSSLFPGNTTFSFTPPDPLQGITSPYTPLFESYLPALKLDNLSHDLKIFEARIEDHWFQYRVDQLLQLRTQLLDISRKVGDAVELWKYASDENFVPSLPSTTAKSNHSTRFRCRLCLRGDRKEYSFRSTFTRHVADRHYAQTVHLCHVPGCTYTHYRTDNIVRHRKNHAAEIPGLSPTPPSDQPLERQIPPPPACCICSTPVKSWKEWMNCIAYHCRILENTRTDSTSGRNGRRDDDDFDYNDNDNGAGHWGGGRSSQNHETYEMGSQFGRFEGASTYGGYYNGFSAQRSSPVGASHRHNTNSANPTPKDDQTPETGSVTEVSDVDTSPGLSEGPKSQHEHGGHTSDQSPKCLSLKTKLDHNAEETTAQQQSNLPQGLGDYNQSPDYLYNDDLNPRPVPRTRLSRAMEKCCFPVSPTNNITTPKFESKMPPAENPKALIQKKFSSRKVSMPVCDARSPKVIHLDQGTSQVRPERRRPTIRGVLLSFNQPLRAFARWQTALKTDIGRGCLV